MDPAADRSRLEDAEEASSPHCLTPQQRLKWTPELHGAFLAALDACGGLTSAKPKEVLESMAVDGLTVSHVKSHLQKHRMNATTTTTTAQPSASAASDGTPPAKRARLQQQVVESAPQSPSVQITVSQMPKIISKAADPRTPRTTATATAGGTEAVTPLPDFERAIRQLKSITTSPATDPRSGVTSPLSLGSPSAFIAVGGGVGGGGGGGAVVGNPLLNLAIPPGMPPFAGMQLGSGQGMPPPVPVTTLPHPHPHHHQQGLFPHIIPAVAPIYLRGGGSTSNHTNAQSSAPNNWRQGASPLPGSTPALQVNPAFPHMATAAMDLTATNQLLRAMMQGEHVAGTGAVAGVGAALHPMPPPSGLALFAAAGVPHHQEVTAAGGHIPLPPGMRSRAGAGSASWPPAPEPSPMSGFLQRTEGLLQHLVTSALRLQGDHARLRDAHVQVAVRLEQQAAGIIEFNESLHQFAALHIEAVAALAAAGAGAAGEE